MVNGVKLGFRGLTPNEHAVDGKKKKKKNIFSFISNISKSSG